MKRRDFFQRATAAAGGAPFLQAAAQVGNPKIERFCNACFTGEYPTGDVTKEYLDGVEAQRRDGAKMSDMEAESAQLDLGLETVE